jgi:chromosome partitioning protein
MREATCCACGKVFSPAYVYQLAVAGTARRYFCTMSCRRQTLGDEGYRARRARRIAILNQKGGTGKTTTAVSLAAGLAERGEECLLVDADGQGNVGASLGVRGAQTLYHVLVEGVDAAEVCVPVRKGLDVITSDATLAAAEIWLARQEPDVRARVLAQRLNITKVTRRYSHVLLDCAPSLSLLNQNALSYADEVIIPVTCDYLALVGVKQVLRTIKDIERHLAHSVRVTAVLPTFYDGRVRLAREAVATLREHFKERCLEPVRQNTRLAEAPAHKKTIFEHAPDSHGAEDYRRVVAWLLGDAAQRGVEAPHHEAEARA